MQITLEDLFVPLIAAVLAFVFMLVGRQLNLFSKTQEKSTQAVFNIGVMEDKFDNLSKLVTENREYVDKRFDSVIALLEKKDEAVKNEFQRKQDKIDEIARQTFKQEVKVDELWRRRNGGNHHPSGTGGALM